MAVWPAVRRLRVPSPPGETRRREWVIANARLCCAGALLLILWLDTPAGLTSRTVAGVITGSYLVGAAGLWVWLRTAVTVDRRLPVAVQGADLVWAALLTELIQGPNPFFLCFVFALIAAAYRWGIVGAVASAFFAMALLLFAELPGIGGAAAAGGGRQWLSRSLYLVVFGILLGFLAEEERLRQTEAVMGARLLERIRAEVGVWATFEAVAGELLALLSANGLVLLFTELQTAREFLWTAEWSRTGALRIASSELSAADRQRFPLKLPADAWLARTTRRGRRAPAIVAIDAHGRRIQPDELAIPDEWTARFGGASVLGVSVSFADIGRGVLLFFNPRAERAAELRLMQRLLAQIAPAMYSVYLLRRLRVRIGALERGRIARELHDGVIQALIAAGMQLEALLQHPRHSPELSRQLAAVQQLLARQVHELRDLTQQLEPADVGPHDLLAHLQMMVERFERETGIAARFISDLDEVALSPPVCHEMSRITQEALVNIRKHSGAANVVVRFTSERGSPKLMIDNDGRGFDFTGRFSLEELDRLRKGPVVIKTRVRGIGGQLTIESHPETGVRMEITLPPRVLVRQRTA